MPLSARAFDIMRRRLAAVPGEWTIHNIRHTIATHLREELRVPREVVSLILGRTQTGPFATRICDRCELLPERRAALVAWAAWLDRLRSADTQGADVLPMTLSPTRRVRGNNV